MQNWKQAYSLAKFELKHSKVTFLLLAGILILVLFLIIPIIPNYFDESSIGLDFFFYLTFTVITQWARPKIFRIQKLSGFRYASFHLIHLNQLAIKREVIVRYRLLTYLVFSIPFHLVFLSSLYFLAPTISQNITVGGYSSFSLFWLCFSIYIGCGNPYSEAGSHLLKNIILSILLTPLLIFVLVVLFYKIHTGGFVNWTMFISNNYPVVTSIGSLILAFIGWNFWMKRMKVKMSKSDYF